MKKVSSSLLLILLLSETMIHPSHSISDAQLKSICSPTISIYICTELLKSDPRTSSTDLPGLVSIAVDLARSRAYYGLSLVQSLEGKASANPVLKQRFRSCSALYTTGRSLLNRAKKSVGLKDYGKVRGRARSAMRRYKQCAKQFTDRAPAMPVELRHMNFALTNLCEIVFTVAGQPGLK